MYPNTNYNNGNNNKEPNYNYPGDPCPQSGQPIERYNLVFPPVSCAQQQNNPPQGYTNIAQPQPRYPPFQYPVQMPQQSILTASYPPTGPPHPGQAMQGFNYPPGQYPQPPYSCPVHFNDSIFGPGMYSVPGLPYMPSRPSLPPLRLQQSPQRTQIPRQNMRPNLIHIAQPTPSLKPLLGCSPDTDAQAIQIVDKGFGCGSSDVIDILTHRTSGHREQIKEAYYAKFGKSLVERMKSELFKKTKRLVICLLYTGSQLDAYILYKSIQGVGTDESTLRMILCTRTSNQIAKIKEIYSTVSKQTLQEDVSGDTSGAFRDILLHMINNPRREENDVNQVEAFNIVSQLYSRPNILAPAPQTWIPIFCETSYAQLRLIMKCFYEQFKISLYKYIKSYFPGDYEKTLLTICSYVWNPYHYFSNYLRNSIKAKDINRVIYVFCTRCETDLANINQDYLSRYYVTLDCEIRQEFQHEDRYVIKGLLNLLGIF